MSGESLSLALNRGTSPQKSAGALHNRKGPPCGMTSKQAPPGETKRRTNPSRFGDNGKSLFNAGVMRVNPDTERRRGWRI